MGKWSNHINIKMDSSTRKVVRENEDHFLVIKVPIYQEDIPILNMYVPNNQASEYNKLKSYKGSIDKSTVLKGDFNF